MARAAEPPVVQPAASDSATAVNIAPITTRLRPWCCAVSLPVSEARREGDATLDSDGTLWGEQPFPTRRSGRSLMPG
jgi:mRNA-degrading endonuclease toxin of MazEF toxin-antitoxin module